MVLTATAVSMMAGKAHAVVELYPMASIRSRSARKLTANAPAPMAAVAADRPAINPPRRSRPDCEGDAVHGGQEGDGWHSGGANLDDDSRQVRQHCVRDVADEADRGRTDEKAPEESDGTVDGFAA